MAEQHTFHLTIARVDGPVYDADAMSVTVPGTEGDLTVLAHHEPIITPLKKGVIVVKRDDGELESFEVESGTIEVSNNRVSILI